MNRDYQPGMLSPTEQQRIMRDIAPDGVIERCAKAVTIQRIAEQISGAILRYNQSTEGKRAAQQAQQRKQRSSVVPQYTDRQYSPHAYSPGETSGGMLYRSYEPYTGSRDGMVWQGHHYEPSPEALRQRQADLARMQKRGAELERQVESEKSWSEWLARQEPDTRAAIERQVARERRGY